MSLPPRNRYKGLLTTGEVLLSVLQGLIITAGVLTLYYIFMQKGLSLPEVRTVVFTTLIMANILLTFSNRSFTENIFKTIQYKNSLAFIVITISIIFLVFIHAIPVVRDLFELSAISNSNLLTCFFTALLCVEWFEVYKTYFKK